MKVFIFLILAIIILSLGILFGVRFLSGEDTWICQNGQWVKHGNPSAAKPSGVCGEIKTISGEIIGLDRSTKTITIKAGSDVNAKINILDDTKLVDEGGSNMPLDSFYEGFLVSITGSVAGQDLYNASEVKLVHAPNIIVFSPSPEDEVGLPLEITGVARVFEAQFNYRLRDSNGNILIENSAMTGPGEANEFRKFDIKTNYPEPKGTEGILEVFDYSAKDGAQIDTVTIPLKFKKVDSIKVKAFFGNSKKDPGGLYCNNSYPVERRVAKTDAVARAALEELLAGPTLQEENAGYFTSINQGVNIQKLSIDKGTASVDFNETLEAAVGGSCRVAAIRSQITETLKQFSTIKKVVISIDGRTEDILQP